MRHALACLDELDAALDRAPRLLVATDFDGTLCPIASSPVGLTIPPAAREILQQLTSADRVTLAVISGRSLKDLAAKVPVPAILGGNHGFEIRGPGLQFDHPEAHRLAPQLAEVRGGLTDAVARWPGAWVEDKGLTVTVHYRQVSAPDQAAVVLAVRRHMGRFGLTFAMRASKKALEIYPRVGWNKGSAVSWIAERLGIEGQPWLSIGDDYADESMFTANAAGPSIYVGFNDRSAARYYVADCSEVLAVLAHLARTYPELARISMAGRP